MPAEPTVKTTTAARKRPAVNKRGAIACVRCKERKAKCVPAPPGSSPLPTCTNCLSASAECVYLDRTPNELFLLEYVSQLEAKVAALEIELAKHTNSSRIPNEAATYAQTQAAAVDALTKAFPPGTWPSADGSTAVDLRQELVSGPNDSPSTEGSMPFASGETQRVKEEEPQEDEEDLARGIGFLSLSGSGEPVYVGASSGINWARVCAAALRRPHVKAPHLSKFSYLPPPSNAPLETALDYTLNHPVPALPPPSLAARYLDAAYQHIQARYGFLDWPSIRNWHENREAICLNRPMWGAGRGPDHKRSMASFMLWLLYGFGARLTEDEHLEGAVSHEIYHNHAIACFSNVASQPSLATVQGELLLTVYSFRHPHPEVSVWHCGGLALRTAIQIGLHRRTRSRTQREKDPLSEELRKRVFWSIYTLDRMLALQLGRPSGIQDRDIDVDLPLNIDVDYTDAREIAVMQQRQIEMNQGRQPGDEYENGYDSVTSMTSFIHNIRLNQLKQRIQDAIYCLDRPSRKMSVGATTRPGQLSEIDGLLQRLKKWHATKPCLPPGRTGGALLGSASFDMEYHNCVQMLLRPVIASGRGNDHYTSVCVESAASYCEIEHAALGPDPKSPRLSNWGLYKTFLSGLTLLHLGSAARTVHLVDSARATSAMRKCQQVLQLYTRFLPNITGYKECFDELMASFERNRLEASSAAGRSASGTMDPRQISSPNAPLRIDSAQTVPSQAGTTATGHSLSHQRQPMAANPTAGVMWHPPLHAHSQHPLNPSLAAASESAPQGVSDPFAQLHHHAPVSRAPAASLDQAGSSGNGGGQHVLNYAFSGRPPIGSPDELPLGNGIREDFFSLLSSLGVDPSAHQSLPAIGEEELWTMYDSWTSSGGDASTADGLLARAGVGAPTADAHLAVLHAPTTQQQQQQGTDLQHQVSASGVDAMDWLEGLNEFQDAGDLNQESWKYPFA